MRLSSYLCVVATLFVLKAPASPTPHFLKHAPETRKKVIVQMFQWSWESIALECTDYLGPAQYGYVQVSPPTEHVTGPQWWTDYQPVSYKLTSKRGNRTQFQNMVRRCKAAGVEVIVDTIFNHMAGLELGTGIAGSNFTRYEYPRIYESRHFHHCGLTPDNRIHNQRDRRQVQTCELAGLADLATETDYVYKRLVRYAKDLVSLGVAGLRLDAAKHIDSTHIRRILRRLPWGLYITQEVPFYEGDAVTPEEYVGNGDVQEFRYTAALKSAFESQGIESLRYLERNRWTKGAKANVFVVNHDTERSGESLSYKSGSNTYTLAMVFSLAYPYGTPTILSSYSFSGIDDGAPESGFGSCYGSGGTNGWLCQHRWPAVAGMVLFFNIVQGTPLNNWQTGSNQQIAFGRGAVGFVAINNADTEWSTTFNTSLPDGKYCEVIKGTGRPQFCTGTSYSVSRRSFYAKVAPRSAIAIYVGAKGDEKRALAP